MGEGSLQGRLGPIFRLLEEDAASLHVWVKNEHSHFLAVSSNLVTASGVSEAVMLSGINDADERLTWARQGPLYLRDDRRVMTEDKPRLRIIERQDTETDTIWLKTSKAPHNEGTGGTVGTFEVISQGEAWRLSGFGATFCASE